MPERWDVFLSYSRSDETFAECLYNDLTTKGLEIWWDHRAMSSRGRTFLQELRDAIEACDRVVAVVSPQALKSEYVRAEWNHALLFCKAVVPLLAKGDHKQLPEELSSFHTQDFTKKSAYRSALNELHRILREKIPPLAPFLGQIPAMPPHFVPRPADLESVQEAVLADVSRPTVITSSRATTALVGMGGIGKSVLAAAFARAAKTRRAFEHGILWLEFGQNANSLAMLGRAIRALDRDAMAPGDVDTAVNDLAGLLDDRSCLLVLDDIWKVEHAAPFRNALGPRCRMLMTTRDGTLVSSLEAQEHRVDVLPIEAALALLSDWSEIPESELPDEAREVAEECGTLPFALALCGAMVRDGNPWSDLVESLREADLSFVRRKLPNYDYPDILRSLKVSLDALAASEPTARKPYELLAVFPDDTLVPESTVTILWEHAASLKGRETRRLLTLLERKALVNLEGKAPERSVSLHDLQRDFLRALQRHPKAPHRTLLDAYRGQFEGGWASGPNDGYFFEHLVGHLRDAGRPAEARKLLLDWAWLRQKLRATSIIELISDYDAVASEEAVEQLKRALQAAADPLSRTPELLGNQLLARLTGVKIRKLQPLLGKIAQGPPRPWLRPVTASLLGPEDPLVWTLRDPVPLGPDEDGAAKSVNAVALTRDGKIGVSGTYGRQIKVWDLSRGTELRTLSGHDGSVEALALTPDGRRLISASADTTLKVWDLASGNELRTLEGHSKRVAALAVSPDGDRVVSGSDDRTLRIWDLDSGRELQTLTGHPDNIYCVAWTPDGKRVLSGGYTGTIKYWNLARPSRPRTLRKEEGDLSVHGIAAAPDGERAIIHDLDYLSVWDLSKGKPVSKIYHNPNHGADAFTTNPDGTLALTATDELIRLWDMESGSERGSLRGHTGVVTALAVTPDARQVLSGAFDDTVRVWDLRRLATADEAEGRVRPIKAVAITPDGELALFASNYGCLKAWDLVSGKEVFTTEEEVLIYDLALTADGRHAVTAVSSGFQVTDIPGWTSRRYRSIHRTPVFRIAVSPDSRSVITTGGSKLVVCDFDDGTIRWANDEFHGPIAITPDSRMLVCGKWEAFGEGGPIALFDIEDGNLLHMLEGHEKGVTALAISMDGKTLVSGSYDKKLMVWDLVKGKRRRTFSAFEPEVIVVGPDTDRVIAGGSAGLRTWGLRRGVRNKTLGGYSLGIKDLALAADGALLATASKTGRLDVWDTGTWDRVASFVADGELTSVASSPDGTRIVSGDSLGHVHLLHLENWSGCEH